MARGVLGGRGNNKVTERTSGPGGREPNPGSDVVLVPAQPVESLSAKGLGFETRILESGESVLIGFSNVDKLVTELGEYQPWIAVTVEELAQAADGAGLRLAIDPTVEANAPRWSRKDFEASSLPHE
jgi:hypothetical protein